MAATGKKQPDLLQRLIASWPESDSGLSVLEVGLSGGCDSVVLLDLCCRWRAEGGPQVTAVHVHHGLSPNADAWADFCRELCASRGVSLRIEHVSVAMAAGKSVEAEARRVRYAAFARSSANLLVLAHHCDDQVETVWLQALRGGGPRALAAMPVWQPGVCPPLWRPLLGVRRVEIEAYACAHGLSWVEDESNDSLVYRRNWLRHTLLPQIEAAVPHYRSHAVGLAARMADAASILDEVAAEDLQRVYTDEGLSLVGLRKLSPARQRNLLLTWLEGLHPQARLPRPEELHVVQGMLAVPQRWQRAMMDGWLVSDGQTLRHLKAVGSEKATRQEGPVPSPEEVPRWRPEGWGGCLSWQRKPGGLKEGVWHEGRVCLKLRAGGERLQQKVGRKPLKTLFQEAGVPAVLRPGWPLLFLDEELVAVVGVAVSSAWQDDRLGWWPEWQPDAS